MESEPIVNHVLVAGNTCFGCGPDNPNGRSVRIWRDGDRSDGLLGSFTPQPFMSGFPGITHGGAIYTALDCIAAWTPTALRPEVKAIWILRSASIRYHRAARAEQEIGLATAVKAETPGRTMVVHATARDGSGALLAEAEFDVVALPPERFRRVAGVAELPEGWRSFLEV
jgi:acyl-CoA thioesterase FadM